LSVIKQLDEVKLVGFRILCPGDQYIVEIPKASKRLSECLPEIKIVINPSWQYGAFVVESKAKEEDGYFICVEVSKFEELPDNMMSLTIPAQQYAVWRHKGPNYKITNAYNDLHNWIEANQYKRLTGQWHLEIFHSWTDTNNVNVELLDTVTLKKQIKYFESFLVF